MLFQHRTFRIRNSRVDNTPSNYIEKSKNVSKISAPCTSCYYKIQIQEENLISYSRCNSTFHPRLSEKFGLSIHSIGVIAIFVFDIYVRRAYVFQSSPIKISEETSTTIKYEKRLRVLCAKHPQERGDPCPRGSPRNRMRRIDAKRGSTGPPPRSAILDTWQQPIVG